MALKDMPENESERYKRERDDARRERDRLDKRIAELEVKCDLLTAIDGVEATPPTWLQPKRGGEARGIANLMLSDLHLDEVVAPAQMNWVNSYNREIATYRLRRTFEKAIEHTRDYLSGVKYEGFGLWLGGDLFSGNIHEELKTTNDAPILASLDYWIDPMVAGMKMLADHFGKVHVPSVVGNHGRNTYKPIMKNRVEDNFDWFFTRCLERELRGDTRFSWSIPKTADVIVQQYNTRVLMTHGDQARGGSGISGIFTPLSLMNFRKGKNYAAMDAPFDHMVLGHFHQYITGPSFTVNGCFPADSWVVTPDGPRSIQTVKEGDTVLSRSGSLEVVTNTFTKQSDNGLVTLHVRGLPRELTATPNHLIWAIKGEATRPVEPSRRHLVGGGDVPQWIPADFISAGDWVHVPTPTPDLDARPMSLDLAWLYGLFLAEGHTTIDGGAGKRANRIGLSMHRREVPVLERAKEILAAEFPEANDAIISLPKSRENSAELVLNGRGLATKFREMFGKGAHDKHVPAEWLTMAPDLQAAVVQGWCDGDGHVRKDGMASATTVSPQLAWAMFYMAFHTGKFPSLRRLQKGGPRLSDSYTIHFNEGQEQRIVDGEVFYRVQNRFRSASVVEVYDLEVSGEHTYVVEGVGVHNSLKGFDEYALISNFGFEVPQQAMWVTTPERGVTWQFAIQPSDPKKEGWA